MKNGHHIFYLSVDNNSRVPIHVNQMDEKLGEACFSLLLISGDSLTHNSYLHVPCFTPLLSHMT